MRNFHVTYRRVRPWQIDKILKTVSHRIWSNEIIFVGNPLIRIYVQDISTYHLAQGPRITLHHTINAVILVEKLLFLYPTAMTNAQGNGQIIAVHVSWYTHRTFLQRQHIGLSYFVKIYTKYYKHSGLFVIGIAKFVFRKCVICKCVSFRKHGEFMLTYTRRWLHNCTAGHLGQSSAEHDIYWSQLLGTCGII